MKKTFTYFLGGALFALFLLMPSSAKAQVTAVWEFHSSSGNYYEAGSANFNTGSKGYLTATADNSTVFHMYVDATSGKLYSRGGDAQFNNGTKLHVPVASLSDVVTVISYPGYHNYKVSGTAATNDETNHTATVAEVEQGYVEIVSTGDAYLYTIQVVATYTPPTPKYATWDFTSTGNAHTEILACSLSSVDQEITVNGLVLTVNAHGAEIKDNGNSVYTIKDAGLTFHVPVTSTEDVVTVNGYPSYCSFSIGGIEHTESYSYTASSTDVANGYVEIVNGITKQSYLVSISLNQKYYFTTVTIGDTGWATFSNAQATDFTDISVNAKIVTGVTGSALTMTDVTGTAAANTGLLLNADEGTYAIPLTTTGTDYSSTNKLVAGTGAAVNYNSGAGYNYVLAKNGGVAVFQRIVEGTYGSVTVAKGKAYLALASNPGAHELTLDFSGGGSTDIQLTKDMGQSVDGIYYNLAGQRVVQPTKGLYIVNGKKVIVK